MLADRTLELVKENFLLRSLPPATQERLGPHLRERELPHKAVIHEPYATVNDLVFPLSGVISWIVTMKDGDMAEAVTIGREGVAGINAALGGHRGSTAAIVQAPGRALSISTADFRRVLENDKALFKMIQHYANTLINVMAQCAACNRLHEVTERCARWLLMMHDRADSDDFTLLQEFLADMLGVRRPSVSVCASILQRAGLISYKRGKVRVENRRGLEEASCECYAVIAGEFTKMQGELQTAR